MSVSEEVLHLINQLDDAELQDALDYLRWLASDEDTLTPEELEEARLGAEEIRRGESISLDEYLRQRSR